MCIMYADRGDRAVTYNLLNYHWYSQCVLTTVRLTLVSPLYGARPVPFHRVEKDAEPALRR